MLNFETNTYVDTMLDINNLPSLDTSGGSLLQAKTYLPLSPNDNV